MRSVVIKENDAGQRLNKFLHKCLPKAPNGFLYKMLRKKNITLNGKKAEGKEILSLSDEVVFFLSDETYQKFAGEEKPPEDEYERAYRTLQGIRLLYEDQHILILNKPDNMLTQKAAAGDLSLNEWVIGYLLKKGVYTAEDLKYFKPSVCNRLDRNTTGLVLAGKTLAGTQMLSDVLKKRSLKKYYRLYVKGRLEEESLLEGYLVKDRETNKVKIAKEPFGSGEAASYIRTAIKPLKVTEEATLLEVRLITGKTHQIRAHLASIGHPVIGDYKYGDRQFNKRFQAETQLLHAYRIVFPKLSEKFQNLSGKEFTAPLPAAFERLCKNS